MTRASAPRMLTRRRLVLVSLLSPVVAALLLTAFGWPAARLAPRGLPVAVAGPDRVVDAIDRRLSESPGAFAIHRYPGASAARTAIRERAVYGAVVATRQGLTVLTASAASPFVGQLLARAVSLRPDPSATGTGAPASPRVIDVVPALAADPRGAALGASLFPLAPTGVITAVLVTSLTAVGLAQAVVLVGGSALAGLAAVGIVQGWFGALDADPL